MDLRLQGKTALVTGASRGIGLATTRALVDEGVRVVAAARNVDGDLKSLPVQTVAVDLGTPDGPAQLVDEALSRVGGIDILVNNVGAVRPRPDGFVSVTDDQWLASLLDIGAFGVVALLWFFTSAIRRLGRLARRDESEDGWLLTGLAASIAASFVRSGRSPRPTFSEAVAW